MTDGKNYGLTITNGLTRKQAREIAEAAFGGSMVWLGGRAYPGDDIEAVIFEAGRASAVPEEPMVPEWALRSQIDICNDLRAQLEAAERALTNPQFLSDIPGLKRIPKGALDEFHKRVRETVIPEIVKTMRQREEAGIAIRDIPLFAAAPLPPEQGEKG